MAYLPHPSPAAISILPVVLARLRGFEPPIFGFVVRCSIQLSYRRAVFMAEREGFEPPEGINLQRFSRPSHSARLCHLSNQNITAHTIIFLAVLLKAKSQKRYYNTQNKYAIKTAGLIFWKLFFSHSCI